MDNLERNVEIFKEYMAGRTIEEICKRYTHCTQTIVDIVKEEDRPKNEIAEALNGIDFSE